MSLTKNQVQLFNAQRQVILDDVREMSDKTVIRRFIFGGYNAEEIIAKCEELYRDDFEKAWSLGKKFGVKIVGWLKDAGAKEPKESPKKIIEFEVLWSGFVSRIRGLVNAGIMLSESEISALEYVSGSDNLARETVVDGYLMQAIYAELEKITHQYIVWLSEFGKLEGMRES